jgi:monovalent cation/proton antiporter MnhG/PhaG subunit
MAPATFSAGEIIALIFVAIGVIFMLISSIGILRLPDVYSRMHAAGKSTTVGVSFVLLGAGVYFWEQHLFARMVLLIILIFATSQSPPRRWRARSIAPAPCGRFTSSTTKSRARRRRRLKTSRPAATAATAELRANMRMLPPFHRVNGQRHDLQFRPDYRPPRFR